MSDDYRAGDDYRATTDQSGMVLLRRVRWVMFDVAQEIESEVVLQSRRVTAEDFDKRVAELRRQGIPFPEHLAIVEFLARYDELGSVTNEKGGSRKGGDL